MRWRIGPCKCDGEITPCCYCTDDVPMFGSATITDAPFADITLSMTNLSDGFSDLTGFHSGVTKEEVFFGFPVNPDEFGVTECERVGVYYLDGASGWVKKLLYTETYPGSGIPVGIPGWTSWADGEPFYWAYEGEVVHVRLYYTSLSGGCTGRCVTLEVTHDDLNPAGPAFSSRKWSKEIHVAADGCLEFTDILLQRVLGDVMTDIKLSLDLTAETAPTEWLDWYTEQFMEGLTFDAIFFHNYIQAWRSRTILPIFSKSGMIDWPSCSIGPDPHDCWRWIQGEHRGDSYIHYDGINDFLAGRMPKLKTETIDVNTWALDETASPDATYLGPVLTGSEGENRFSGFEIDRPFAPFADPHGGIHSSDGVPGKCQDHVFMGVWRIVTNSNYWKESVIFPEDPDTLEWYAGTTTYHPFYLAFFDDEIVLYILFSGPHSTSNSVEWLAFSATYGEWLWNDSGGPHYKYTVLSYDASRSNFSASQWQGSAGGEILVAFRDDDTLPDRPVIYGSARSTIPFTSQSGSGSVS